MIYKFKREFKVVLKFTQYKTRNFIKLTLINYARSLQ